MTAGGRVDAVVVGGGPNGLAAAITLARAGRSVTVLEGAPTVGGGVRSAERTLPGFVHDVCSAIHPFGRASPFFAALRLERHGLRWIDPPFAIAHPLDDGTAAMVARDVDQTAAGLGPDGDAYDASRAPSGRHTVRAYCHVPNGSTADMTEPILRQIERFAPGFRERILFTASTGPAALEAYNANNVGGDIAGGRQDLRQLFTRPSLRLFDPYSTPDPSIFICSASTPPGGGVHGMCGYHAGRSALRRLA